MQAFIKKRPQKFVNTPNFNGYKRDTKDANIVYINWSASMSRCLFSSQPNIALLQQDS